MDRVRGKADETAGVRGLKPRKTTPGKGVGWGVALCARVSAESQARNDDTFEANYRRLINAHYQAWLACGGVRYRRGAIKKFGPRRRTIANRGDVNCSFRCSLPSMYNTILFLFYFIFFCFLCPDSLVLHFFFLLDSFPPVCLPFSPFPFCFSFGVATPRNIAPRDL